MIGFGLEVEQNSPGQMDVSGEVRIKIIRSDGIFRIAQF